MPETSVIANGTPMPPVMPAKLIDRLPIKVLHESPLNPRKHFDAVQLGELAESLKGSIGVIEPLVVRPHSRKQGEYEIIAGAKRRRAAEMAGLADVPVRVVDWSDVQVLEAMVIENDQREAPHPLDQADGYARLLKLGGYTVETLAAKIGREAGFVYRRMKLSELIDAIKKAFWDGEILYVHAVLLSRLPMPADQAEVFKNGCFREEYDGETRTRRRVLVSKAELEMFIRNKFYLDLAKARFPLNAEKLVLKAGSCTSCSKRTGGQRLFDDDLAPEDNRCLDRACYELKQNTYIRIRLLESSVEPERLFPIALGTGYSGNEEKRLPKATLFPERHSSGIKLLSKDQPKCASAEKGLIVALGYAVDKGVVGDTLYFCRQKNCKTHGAAAVRHSGSARSVSTPRPASEIWEEKERALNGEIEKLGRGALVDRVVAASKGSFEIFHARLLAAYIISSGDPESVEAIAGELGLPVSKNYNELSKAVESALFTVKDDKIAPVLLRLLCMADDVSYGGRRHSMDRLIDKYKIDRKKVLAGVGKEKRAAFAAEKKAALAKTTKPAKAKVPKKASPVAKAKGKAKR